MDEHWHDVYVTETVKEVVEILQSQGIKVSYEPNLEDPEDSSGHIKDYDCLIMSMSCLKECSYSSTLKEAKSRLRLASFFLDFAILQAIKHLHVVQDCGYCDRG